MPWLEVGDRVFTRRFDFLDQQIGVVLGGDDVLLVDTRSAPAHAREVIAELRELTSNPISIVVDTHWHWDHAFGNAALRPATIWGHVRTAERLRAEGATRLADLSTEVAAQHPDLAAALAEVVVDPPDRTFSEVASVEVGDRIVERRGRRSHRRARVPRPGAHRRGHQRPRPGRERALRRRPARGGCVTELR